MPFSPYYLGGTKICKVLNTQGWDYQRRKAGSVEAPERQLSKSSERHRGLRAPLPRRRRAGRAGFPPSFGLAARARSMKPVIPTIMTPRPGSYRFACLRLPGLRPVAPAAAAIPVPPLGMGLSDGLRVRFAAAIRFSCACHSGLWVWPRRWRSRAWARHAGSCGCRFRRWAR